MFPQGSFALGTVTRPLNGEEYDLDFICHLLAAGHTAHTPRNVYELLFQRLKDNGTYEGMVQLKNRCVRVIYANLFHMDITVAVNNPLCSNGGLLVPDRELRNWKASHPAGYVAWFKKRAALNPQFRLLEKAFAQRHYVRVVANPTTQGENFADKWKRGPEYSIAFAEWQQQAIADFGRLAELEGRDRLQESFRGLFGSRDTDPVFGTQTEHLNTQRLQQAAALTPLVGAGTKGLVNAAGGQPTGTLAAGQDFDCW
nr:hypothetical protein [Tanacetum cinerariifolium]